MNSDTRSPIGFLPAGWKLDSLKNITTKIGSGSTPRGGEAAYLEERIEYAFIRSQNIFDFQFSESEVKYISDSDANKLKNAHLQRDDLLLNITGDGITFARCCIVPEEILPAAVNQHVSIIRLDQEKCLPGYLLAYLCLPQIKEYISNFNAGGSRRAITKGHIETFDIPLPPMSIQRSIQRFTFDVMHKVRANTHLNQNLEKIAQAIFKSWFVDFEPTKAKIAAREALLAENPAATPEQIATTEQQGAIQSIAGAGEIIPTEQLQSIADLFPNQLVHSELGEIPDGWESTRFKPIVEKYIDNRGKTPPTLAHGIPLLEVKHLKDDSPYPDELTDKYVDEKTYHEWFRAHLEAEDLIMSTVGTIGRLCLMPENCKLTIAQNLLGLRFKKSEVSPLFMYYQMSGFKFKHDVDARLVVTVQASIKRKDLETIDLLKPNIEIQNVFDRVVSPLLKMQSHRQNLVLGELRDLLLPKLLSGTELS